jgi:N-acetyl-1-D-myo-inositol-2-amino-2-deoxy-alpha-D-glucopyranoside deacetylase
MSEAKQVLLAVLAHPDDETFGTGGTLAMYARKGVDVHLVCATKGEVGDVDARYMEGFATVAERRESELRCAAGILGLKGVHFMGYRDSGMPGSPDNSHPNALVAQPLDQVAADVAHYFRRLKPQVVITFDPIGGYRHPDHIAIHQATVRAFEAVQKDINAFPGADGLPGFQPQKLYFQTISRSFMRFGVRLLRLLGRDPHHFGRNGDIDLASLAAVEFPVHARIDYRQVAKERNEAAACHASQGGEQQGGGLIGIIRRLTGAYDTYMRSFPAPIPGKIEKDLFAGVN